MERDRGGDKRREKRRVMKRGEGEGRRRGDVGEKEERERIRGRRMERSKERGGSEEVKKKIKWRGVGKEEKVVGDRRKGDIHNNLLTK